MKSITETASRDADSAQNGGYDEYVAQALATEGGHLSIGRGGFTLYFGWGRLSGYDIETMKVACTAAGLPVIDSRCLPFKTVYDLAVRGPMVAVGEPPSPPPYHALSYTPLAVVAEAYRAAGAEVFNVPPRGTATPEE